MRKVSELLNIALVEYEKCNNLFMCHLVSGSYKINGIDLNFTEEEQEIAINTISKRIDYEITLDSFLCKNDAKYNEVSRNGLYWKNEDALRIRVGFWSKFICELMIEGQ